LREWQQISIVRLRAARDGTEPAMPAWLHGQSPARHELTDEFNARIFAQHNGRDCADVLADWRAGFAEFIALAEATPEGVLIDKARFAWLNGYALLDVLQGSFGHHHEHLTKLTGFQGGAAVYARDLDRMAAFYEHALGLDRVDEEEGYVLFEGGALQLVLVRMNAQLAAEITITDPPQRREDTPIKLVLPVHNIAAVRERVPAYGGMLNPPEREWRFQGDSVCDGHDSEGNVFQVREAARR
jgi:predicted enzyme related to lactoylglutathione lyase